VNSLQQVQSVAPWYAFSAGDQSGRSLDAYLFETNDANACVRAFSDFFGKKLGMAMSFGQARKVKLAGRDAIAVGLQFRSAQGVAGEGELFLVERSGGMFGLSCTTAQGGYQGARDTFEKVLQNVSVRGGK
jgi:hypothetical protein